MRFLVLFILLGVCSANSKEVQNSSELESPFPFSQKHSHPWCQSSNQKNYDWDLLARTSTHKSTTASQKVDIKASQKTEPNISANHPTRVPKVRDALFVGIQNTLESTVDFWTPVLENVAESNKDYWGPKLVRTGTFALDQFSEKVRPQMMNLYKLYLNSIGQDIGDGIVATIDFTEPRVEKQLIRIQKFINSKQPGVAKELSQVPAPVKKVYEQMIVAIWRGLLSADKSSLNIPNNLSSAFDVALSATQALDADTSSPEQIRVTRLLNMLKPFAEDNGMKNCYRATIIEADMENAFNIGCNIFVTRELSHNLKDDELIAVLAHEMSHGDQGHALKNMSFLLGIFGAQTAKLFIEEMAWFLTDETYPYNQAVIDGGQMPLVLDAFGKKAPLQEIEADRGGVRILNRMGISGEVMERTLLKIHGVKLSDLKSMDPGSDAIRDYPSAYQRIKAVYNESCY